MKKYDDIVVGSGISGLTLSVLLGMNNRRVLLIEKNSYIGGSLVRFYKNGLPFDTGFHFSGGFDKNGLLYEMLNVLDIKDSIEPIYLSSGDSNRIVFESNKTFFSIPMGYDNVVKRIKGYFPEEIDGIDKYFSMIKNVFVKTGTMNLKNIFSFVDFIEEDFISLESVLNNLIKDKQLKNILSIYSMCYGVKASEISFANHSRVCYGLYESIARIKNGGDAFINAFKDKIEKYDIDVLCKSYITDFIDIDKKKVKTFVLNTGEKINASNCIFTIHPKNIVKVLSKKYFSNAFFDRVDSFETSIGFFSIFGFLELKKEPTDKTPSIVSILSDTDINMAFDVNEKNNVPLIIIKSFECINNKYFELINAFELSLFNDVKKWEKTKIGKRGNSYIKYKKKKIENIINRINNIYPNFSNEFNFVDAASMLTYRDYLNSYDGSAYGIKQKIGQFNLFGKLSLNNIYVAGQSSVLPGLVGAMMSSFIIARRIIDKNIYQNFIKKGLKE